MRDSRSSTATQTRQAVPHLNILCQAPYLLEGVGLGERKFLTVSHRKTVLKDGYRGLVQGCNASICPTIKQ